MYYPCSENKGADITAKLICDFVFAYADCWFSHEAAHFYPIRSTGTTADNYTTIVIRGHVLSYALWFNAPFNGRSVVVSVKGPGICIKTLKRQPRHQSGERALGYHKTITYKIPPTRGP